MTERYNTYFPSQKIATMSKNKEWFRNCIDSAINLSSLSVSGKGQRTYYEKKLLRDLENGIIDPQDVETTTNYIPIAFGTKTLDSLQNYPLAQPRIDLLVGESIKRRFDWLVKVINEDAISEKEDDLKKQVMSQLFELSQKPGLKEEELQAKLQELTKWEYYEYQDLRERLSSQILHYLWREQELPIKFMEGMNNALNIGEECYCIEIIGDDPKFRVVDPLNISYLRNASSYRLEDSDIIVEDRYLPIGSAIDAYFDFLTSSQIDELEKGYGGGTTSTDGVLKTNTYPAMQSDWFGDSALNNGLVNFFSSVGASTNSGPYDNNGNVRVSRVVWKGLRKIGLKSFYDEQGILQKDVVDENYKPNAELGEKIKWIWISEWYEGTRIGEDIYVKMMPRPIQFRRMDNLSASSSGYVGTIYPQSLLEIMKPYQYFYVLVLEELKKAVRKFKAPQIELDLAKIPDNWTLDNWMYYAEEMGYIIVDSFKEGDKGLSTGKLAGAYNTSGKVYNPDMGNYIAQLQLILQFIERQIAVISGVSDQRLGQIENRETVGGIERAVTQSSNITERIFAMHDNTRLRALELLLETAKFAWRNKKVKKTQYILDDMSSFILDVDTDLFNEADYGVFVNNASDDTELMSSMKQLAHAMIQTDKINVKDLMTILTSPSISSMRKELERSEGERSKALAKQQEVENQQLQQDLQQRAAQAQALMDLDREKNIRDNETRIAIAMMKSQEDASVEDTSPESIQETPDIDYQKLDLERQKTTEGLILERDKLDETIRHNIETEHISKIKKPATPAKSSTTK
jgi:hypothetical protein